MRLNETQINFKMLYCEIYWVCESSNKAVHSEEKGIRGLCQWNFREEYLAIRGRLGHSLWSKRQTSTTYIFHNEDGNIKLNRSLWVLKAAYFIPKNTALCFTPGDMKSCQFWGSPKAEKGSVAGQYCGGSRPATWVI